ncbi:DNA-3-methyladenine glycosylase [Paenibacillus sp. YPG26]|uniref:DNA-3-methyladenine glycosylase n=1 Tax=Paenibacillus sp. YPG26 TaxID=2878915 RepID=UPI00203F5CD7|nr:DNA-3-methyladenine glycosylase [Paenibacillus sp. YPG26]USB33366.1 DNA-3-methyladenine glycosylase [Paenibacillus sp. YPG26]
MNDEHMSNPNTDDRITEMTASESPARQHDEQRIPPPRLLPSSIYQVTALEAAPRLLGHTLVRRTEDGEIRSRIIETEAYGGVEDKGSHAFGGRRTNRTSIMFGEGGSAYVYLIYGMYSCLNVVTGREGDPQAVLIRATEPLTEVDRLIMAKYRDIQSRKPADLSNGPGKLCRALRIDRSLNGLDLRAPGGPIWLEAGDEHQDFDIVESPRINIDYAEEYAAKPWRFNIKDHPFVSVKAKHAPICGTFQGLQLR